MRSITAMALLALTIVIGLSTQPALAEYGVASWNTSCKKDLRNLKRQSGWKALAVSNIYLVKVQEWQSCGTAWAYSTKQNASQVALSECRAAMKRQRAPKSARCVVKWVTK
jgi:hypothetical protein